jgi:hypothetical protein
MFVVAIAELASSGEAGEEDVSALARDLGMGAYDVRLRLAGGLPAVILTMADEAAAHAALEAVRRRGHGALVCDLRDVVQGPSMVPVRHFVLDDGSIRADRASPDVLRYASILALVHVANRELHYVIGHERVFVGPREGVMRRETLTAEHDAPHSLYIFPADGGTPWLLREREAHYAALGAAAGPVQHLNFLATIGALRARAPRACFDARLAGHQRSPGHITRSFGRPDGGAGPWADHDADLAAHLLARWFAQKTLSSGADGPYRSAPD